jgi:prepilin-type N-terminal cleavage/methylation domain-containing protein
MTRLRSRAVRRRGYTLIELLLALAVLAMLAGVIVPNGLRMHADSRLSEVAELVRAHAAGTRARAIEHGLVYQFRFEPDGRNFVSIPFEREFEGSDLTSTGSGGTTGLGQFTRFAGQLPSGFRFIDVSGGGAQARQQLSEEAFDQLPNASELTGLDWSPPLLFSPDGSAIDAAFEIADRRNLAIRLEVRGLTGAATLSRMMPASETSP